jgi:hypothetical protein
MVEYGRKREEVLVDPFWVDRDAIDLPVPCLPDFTSNIVSVSLFTQRHPS